MKTHPHLALGIGSRPWTTYGVKGGRAYVKSALPWGPEGSVDISNAGIDLKDRSILGHGTIVIRSNSSELVWPNVPGAKHLRNQLERFAQGVEDPDSGTESFHDEQKRLAGKRRRAHFGPGTEQSIPPSAAPERVATAQGTFVDNKDGTVTHLESGTMYMGGPWGTQYVHEHFVGDPIGVDWRRATKLFGHGEPVQTCRGIIFGDKLIESSPSRGYFRGTVNVSFAGYSDWRLPTAIELHRIGMSRISRHLGDLSSGDDGWNCYASSASTAARKKLFPYFDDGNAVRDWVLWSGTNARNGRHAWAIPCKWPLVDISESARLGVLLVRSPA